MPKSTTRSTPRARLSCGCEHCSCCRRSPRCVCHDYNALLALALWEYGRVLRRGFASQR